MDLLTNRTGKLGKQVYAFNLPAYDTCPGATATCAAVCYAAKVERIYQNARAAYAANLDYVQSSGDWTNDIIAQIKRQRIRTVRPHADGDFFAIAAACPETTFYAYTRSWRVAELRPALDILRSLPNVRILASVDSDAPNAPEGWRVARMLTKDETKAAKQTGRTKHAGMLCPEQTGKVSDCGACKACFGKGRAPINFMLH